MSDLNSKSHLGVGGTDNAEATGPIKVESSERSHWPLIPHMTVSYTHLTLPTILRV